MSAPLPARRTLDFFDAQSRARRNTGLLVFLFVFAWLATIALADVGLSIALSVDPGTLLLPVAGLVTLSTLLAMASLPLALGILLPTLETLR